MAHCFRSLMLVLGLLAGAAVAEETLVVASTTSTEQSGLFGWILPRFEQSTAIKVRVVAVGTGQALDIGRRGLRHARRREGRPAHPSMRALRPPVRLAPPLGALLGDGEVLQRSLPAR